MAGYEQERKFFHVQTAIDTLVQFKSKQTTLKESNNNKRVSK